MASLDIFFFPCLNPIASWLESVINSLRIVSSIDVVVKRFYFRGQYFLLNLHAGCHRLASWLQILIDNFRDWSLILLRFILWNYFLAMLLNFVYYFDIIIFHSKSESFFFILVLLEYLRLHGWLINGGFRCGKRSLRFNFARIRNVNFGWGSDLI